MNDVIHIFEGLENKMEGIIPEKTHENTSVIDKFFDIKTEKQIIGNNGQNNHVKYCESPLKDEILLKRHMDEECNKKMKSFKNSNISPENIILYKRRAHNVTFAENNHFNMEPYGG